MCNWDKCPLMFSQSVIELPEGLFLCLWWGEGRGSLQPQAYLYHHGSASFGNPTALILQGNWESRGKAPFIKRPEAALSVPLSHHGRLWNSDQSELFLKLPLCKDNPRPPDSLVLCKVSGGDFGTTTTHPPPPSITHLPSDFLTSPTWEVCLTLCPAEKTCLGKS